MRSRAIILSIVSLLFLSCSAVSMHAQVARKKSAPVQSTPTPEPSRADTKKLPTEQITPAPGSDKGIIIVGGRGNKPVEATKPIGPLETRDAGPKITPNPNPVYIPKGQTKTQASIGWDVGPGLWYCEIFMSVNGGEESELGRGHDGAKPVTIELGSNYDFRMVVYSGENGEDPKTITTLNIKGQLQPETPPSGGGGAIPNNGMFKAKPGAAKDIATQFFLNPKVKPQPDSAVTFSFETAQPSEFFVEVSKQRPDPNAAVRVRPGEKLGAAFPPNTQLAAFTLPGLSGVKTKHEVTIRGAAGLVLEANTTYHFVITAKDPAGSFWRHGGSFRTGGRDVRVVWEKIKIINDSDDVGCGEVDLWFWANYGQEGGKYLGIGRFNKDSACTDHVYELNREMIVEDAPDTLSLSISGKDDDDNTGAFDVRLGADIRAPLKAPRDGGISEMNVAAQDFNLTGFEVGASIPFKMISMPAFGHRDEGDFMFEVWGRLEILAPR